MKAERARQIERWAKTNRPSGYSFENIVDYMRDAGARPHTATVCAAVHATVYNRQTGIGGLQRSDVQKRFPGLVVTESQFKDALHWLRVVGIFTPLTKDEPVQEEEQEIQVHEDTVEVTMKGDDTLITVTHLLSQLTEREPELFDTLLRGLTKDTVLKHLRGQIFYFGDSAAEYAIDILDRTAHTTVLNHTTSPDGTRVVDLRLVYSAKPVVGGGSDG